MSKSEPPLPLTPAVFHILLALFGKERHGYEIMQQVKADSGDTVKMGPGTLYGSLDRMIEAGLVARGNTQDPRRIYYRLTALGQTTLRAETDRLSRVARVARREGQLMRPKRLKMISMLRLEARLLKFAPRNMSECTVPAAPSAMVSIFVITETIGQILGGTLQAGHQRG
jgi:DNA-binding PadR family transcriptional regulator